MRKWKRSQVIEQEKKMKKYSAVALPLIVIISLMPLGVLNGQPELFDQKKSRQELEIMEGILQTTLQFALKEVKSQNEPGKDEKLKPDFYGEIGGFSNIESFYLYGQGVIFIIPTASLQNRSTLAGFVEYAALTDKSEFFQLAPGWPGSSPAPAIARRAEVDKSDSKQSEGNQTEVRKRLSDAQERVKKRKEAEVSLRMKLDELLVRVKSSMIEALANYGDSLTQVKPNEYVTLIFSSERSSHFKIMTAGENPRQQEIVSVQKSLITDHKAGRLSLESFKQKVLNYKN